MSRRKRHASLPAMLVVGALAAAPALARPFEVRVDEGAEGKPRVVLAPRDGDEAVMVVSFAVGSVDDGIASGLTRLTQHMLVDGNAREKGGSLRRDLYAAAAELEITTEVRRATFRLRAPRASFPALAERLLAALFSPKLDKRQLARMKRLTRNDELAPGGRDDALAFLAGSVLMAESGGASGADFTNDPYGDADVIQRLTFEDVETHVSTKLTPANATVLVTGDFDGERLLRAISAHEGGQRRPLSRPDVTPYLPLSFERRAPGERYLEAHVIALSSAQEAAAARLLAALLEERVEAALRKKGVSYELDAYVLRREWLDLLVIEVPITAGRGQGIDVELRALVASLRDGTFKPGEFERNKRFALAELLRDDGDPARLADALDAAGRVRWHDDEVRAALESMAQAPFLANARVWLDDKRAIRVTFTRAAPEGGP